MHQQASRARIQHYVEEVEGKSLAWPSQTPFNMTSFVCKVLGQVRCKAVPKNVLNLSLKLPFVRLNRTWWSA